MAENGTITETPHSFGILTDCSRRLMLTSAVDIERLVSSSGSESVILLHRTKMSAFEANSRSVGRHFPAMGGHRIQL